jgi:hypothetical protein
MLPYKVPVPAATRAPFSAISPLSRPGQSRAPSLCYAPFLLLCILFTLSSISFSSSNSTTKCSEFWGSTQAEGDLGKLVILALGILRKHLCDLGLELGRILEEIRRDNFGRSRPYREEHGRWQHPLPHVELGCDRSEIFNVGQSSLRELRVS